MKNCDILLHENNIYLLVCVRYKNAYTNTSFTQSMIFIKNAIFDLDLWWKLNHSIWFS